MRPSRGCDTVRTSRQGKYQIASNTRQACKYLTQASSKLYKWSKCSTRAKIYVLDVKPLDRLESSLDEGLVSAAQRRPILGLSRACELQLAGLVGSLACELQLAGLVGSLACELQLAGLVGSLACELQLAGLVGSLACELQLAGLVGSLACELQLAGLVGSLACELQLAGLVGSLACKLQLAGLVGSLACKLQLAGLVGSLACKLQLAGLVGSLACKLQLAGLVGSLAASGRCGAWRYIGRGVDDRLPQSPLIARDVVARTREHFRDTRQISVHTYIFISRLGQSMGLLCKLQAAVSSD
ncbi:uncharacterized protein [Maniola hyperantus]|uniref:uncharacterized protein n=1 Tax=Aphantopus hyperantus TaxID=2795564 RepID=UPI0021222A28